ncbi:hypothetical protein BDEG_27211 [Batrachochytrium dendrobatidis JEL423]|uniref:Uncharacterized protein n=1 Tax=Batrachochytrium dendrobatidis (strain JEL423) TaxID=403673 RepID=A0A177WUZ4_BATDL|nr:hypothetical protein BDEG_27211 [Batrachochytrium dendrobatidis JEL423]
MAGLYNAYQTPSAIFMGIAFHQVISALFFIATRRRPLHTAIDLIALVSLIVCAGQIYVHTLLIDQFISPETTVENWVEWLAASGYLLTFLTSTGVLVLMVARLRVFHKGTPVFWIITAGIVASFACQHSLVHLAYYRILSSSEDKLSLFQKVHYFILLFAIKCIFEGIISATPSLIFLWTISKGTGVHRSEFIKQLFLKYEGFRFVVIFVLNITMAGFAVHSAYTGEPFVAYTAWFFSPMMYGLEIYTFLLVSFVAPSDILRARHDSSSDDGLHGTAAEHAGCCAIDITPKAKVEMAIRNMIMGQDK